MSCESSNPRSHNIRNAKEFLKVFGIYRPLLESYLQKKKSEKTPKPGAHQRHINHPISNAIPYATKNTLSSPSLDPAHQLDDFPGVVAGLPHGLFAGDVVLPVLDLPGGADVAAAAAHAVDGDDQRCEESDAGALEHVHGHERPAQQGGADGHVPRGGAPELVGVEAVVDGVHLRPVDGVAAVRVRLGDEAAGAAQEGADGRGAEAHGCCCFEKGCCGGWLVVWFETGNVVSLVGVEVLW